MPIKRRRRRPEQDLQILLVRLLDAVLLPADQGGCWWTAINPVPGKTPVAAAISRAMGMRAGAPDLLFVWRGAILIELKAGSGRASEAQEAALSAISDAGAIVRVCRSADEVLEVLATYRVPMRGRVMTGAGAPRLDVVG